MSRHGVTIPFDHVPLPEQREWYVEAAELGYTDLWSSEAGGTDAFTPLALAAAVAAVVFGRRFAAGHYLEDQLLTDRRVVVVPRVGAAYGLPLADIQSVELRGTKALFTAGGHQLRFSFVRRHRALRKALETGAPHISFEQRWDPNCAG